MRTLTSTLANAQRAGGNALWKGVFTKAGQTTRTYGVDTANILLNLSHIEQEWSQKASLLVENGDGALTSLNLTGYTSTISYGYNTSAGDEYSACAPLEVVGQHGTTDFANGKFYILFTAEGVFDFMAKDEASAAYNPNSGNTDTIKTILTAIANATLSCFSHCKNYTITFDSEDSLIDSFVPADFFKVSFKESRLSAFKRAIAWTKCKARIEDDAEIHVFNPTISGASYDYEYNDAIAAANHNFFEKSVRQRLVIPNRVYVDSVYPNEGLFTGNATDSDSYDQLGRYIDEFNQLRVTSNSQATAVATAIMQHYQVGHEKGAGKAPINCGQEFMDYILITDSAAGDTRAGNIGHIKRMCGLGKFDMEFGFGDPMLGGIATLLPSNVADLTLSLQERIALLSDAYNNLASYISLILDNQQVMAANLKTLWDYLIPGDDVNFKKLTVENELNIPSESA